MRDDDDDDDDLPGDLPPARRAARSHLRALAAAPVALLAAAACTGVIGEPGARIDRPAPADAATTMAPDGAPPASAYVSLRCDHPSVPAAASMRRLTNREYARTVQDLLGAGRASVDAVTASMPADSVVNGFDNNGQGALSTTHVQSYLDAAEHLATDLFAAPARRDALLGCTPSAPADAACLRPFITRFGRRAFRRPLADEEITALLALATDATAGDADPYAGATVIVEAMLQSPHLLDRPEVGVPDATRPALRRLTGFELATRLSYLLWGTTPDDALLDQAAQGRLDTAPGVEAAARAMLADARAHDGLRGFSAQWLRLTALPALTRDAATFPEWNAGLAGAMAEETARLVDDHVFDPAANFLDLVTAGYTYVNAPLAALYGLSAPAGDAWQRVALAGSATRGGGLFTQASYLAVTSHEIAASVTRRGHFVRTVLLCDELPPPPANVNPTRLPPMPDETERQSIERQTLTPPNCAGCHTRMDPIGFGLLHYDAIGRYHATDAAGRAIDAHGTVAGLPAPTFDGPAELAALVRASPRTAQCVARQVFRYALGRGEDPDPASDREPDDLCTVGEAEQAFRDGGFRFVDLVAALVRSDGFRFIQPPATTAAPGGP